MTVCPCCGCKFAGELSEGCIACGAQSVGEPLAQPEHLLPFYGRALFVTAVGALMLLIFMGSTFAALLERAHLTFDFWSIMAAAETAAWRLKWLALPILPLALWACLRVCASLRREPARFTGSRFAHAGLASSALVILMFATCIGVTIPERLRQRERSLEAAQEARLYTFHRAMLEYSLRYKTLPSDLSDLKDKIPDEDGSIAAMLAGIDPSGYKSWSLVASLPSKKSGSLRGAALRKVSASTDDSPTEGTMSLTDYEMRLPGEDKILNTDDDWIVRNGVVTKPSPVNTQIGSARSANSPDAR
ncbi:MAG: hypothetical protein QOD00_214 [Blastocatellia bacterium]|nr:hypothetical protein [Blastocatellia bacterium]